MAKNAARAHRDTTVVKIDSTWSPRGTEGEKYLASGVRVSMRLWEKEPVGETRASERSYETVGYVISGCAELHVEGQVVRLDPGDSYIVPRGARHHYRILEAFTAVEATSPPAQVHGRDERGQSAGHVDREARDRFVHHVEAHASLPRHIPAAEAISAVMCTLTERLTAGEAHELLEALPRSVRPLFARCNGHRGRRPVAKLDRAEFLDRVARHLAVTPAHAELVCAAVFEAVSAELPPKLADDVAHQLPRDLQDLWLSPQPDALASPVLTQDDAREVLEEINTRIELPAGASPADAFTAVMCALCDRLSGGEARDVLLGLPASVRPLVEQCVVHRGETAAVFDRRQLLRRIGSHLGIDDDHAADLARAVFGAVKRVLPEKEVHDVTSQLPADLVELWLEH
jgi:uncharacterized protein (DUF2267 family)/quercetin dioxygenase-like cupin family protein